MDGSQVMNTPPTAPVEVVVAREHGALVQRLLARKDVPCGLPEDSVDLGLMLLTLTPAAADALVAALPASPANPGYATWTERRRHHERADVGDVLTSLRSTFEERYAGWVPTLGRNRLVGPVSGGGGSVSHGGGGAPTSSGPKTPWRLGTGGDGVAVGVVDTALFAHPDLAGGYRGLSGRDVLPAPEKSDTLPFAAGHATFVTGVILDEAPGATVRVRGVLGTGGDATSWDVAKAIVDLGRSGIQILNLSLVCYTDDNKPPLVLSTAIDRLPPDVLVIACAGNHGDPKLPLDEAHRVPSWPAALDDVVAVGSALPSGASYTPSPFTPLDAEWIDILTEGEAVTSTYLTGTGTGMHGESGTFAGWATWEGTSFSAARLTGRVAALASERNLTPREAYAQLVPARPTQAQSRPDDGPYLPPFLPS